jgi:hypothetical protein
VVFQNLVVTPLTSPVLQAFRRMADATLTPKQLALILGKLEQVLANVTQVREEVISSMARRIQAPHRLDKTTRRRRLNARVRR